MTAIHDQARNGAGKGMASAGALQWLLYAAKEFSGFALGIAASAWVLGWVIVPAVQRHLLEPYPDTVAKQLAKSALLLAQVRVAIAVFVLATLLAYFFEGRKPFFTATELVLCLNLGLSALLIFWLSSSSTGLPPIP